MRTEILLNDKWCFHKGDINVERPAKKGSAYSETKTVRKQCGPASYFYKDHPDFFSSGQEVLSHERWDEVNLPHDFIVNQDLCEDENNSFGYLHYDNAWYRKHFTLPEGSEDKRVLLRFDGIATISVIYVNGCLMYHNFSAYNTFEIDISDVVYFDKENVIAVYVSTEEFEGWWYQGGGIYRDVHLTLTERVAIDLYGVYAPYKKLNETDWQICFETTVVNSDYTDCDVTVKSMVVNAEGNTVAEAIGEGTVCVRDKKTLSYSTVVSSPLLWDCDTPNLYTVKTVLYKNGELIDENYTRIGFRTVEVSVDKGLLINGKKTIIKGVCGHQDFGLTGLAVPENIAKYKVSLMKEMGANGYRTTHYQQTEFYMDAFDEMGFLVMDEARWFESSKESFEQIESLVKRDRNRPSVIFWSTSNEEPLHIKENGRRIHLAISEHIKKFDKTRMITAAVCDAPDKCTIYDDCDVVGINYNLAIYDTVHEMRPTKPMFASECCATGTTRDWNFEPDSNYRLRDKDRDSGNYFLGREKTWKHLMARPYVFGGYQWIAVEHRGEAAWPAICSKSGAIDLFLQKKGAFYQNQSFWTDEPMAHIVPHWNFCGMEGQDILVTVYTNCDELELYLNGRSLGKNQIEKYGHGEWVVPYESGRLSVVGYINGEAVCEDVRQTTGKPVKLKLTLNNEFCANGRDMALFTCECLDENGLVVPDAAEFVNFSVGTPAYIVGTGSDHCDHKNVANRERQMYMGKISIAVKPYAGQQELILTAFSDNCGYAQLTIKL